MLSITNEVDPLIFRCIHAYFHQASSSFSTSIGGSSTTTSFPLWQEEPSPFASDIKGKLNGEDGECGSMRKVKTEKRMREEKGVMRK